MDNELRINNASPTLVRAELVIHLDTGRQELVTHGPDGNGTPIWPGGHFDARPLADVLAAGGSRVS